MELADRYGGDKPGDRALIDSHEYSVWVLYGILRRFVGEGKDLFTAAAGSVTGKATCRNHCLTSLMS